MSSVTSLQPVPAFVLLFARMFKPGADSCIRRGSGGRSAARTSADILSAELRVLTTRAPSVRAANHVQPCQPYIFRGHRCPDVPRASGDASRPWVPWDGPSTMLRRGRPCLGAKPASQDSSDLTDSPRVRTQAQRQYSLIWAPVVSATVGGAKTVENNVESCIGGVVIPQSDEEDMSAPFLPVLVH